MALVGTADMRAVLARDDDARLALGVYLHRLAAGVAAMAVALGGADALVFTGGVGERAPRSRAGAAERLRLLGVELDVTAGTGRRAATPRSRPPMPPCAPPL